MSIISTIKINNEYYDPGETVELSYVTGSGDDAKTHQIELQRLKHVKKGHFIYAELKNAKNIWNPCWIFISTYFTASKCRCSKG